jgi:hypothetical protein
MAKALKSLGDLVCFEVKVFEQLKILLDSLLKTSQTITPIVAVSFFNFVFLLFFKNF